MPLGPTASYLARYNGYQLPGYVQNEQMGSDMNIASHYGVYADGSESEYTGLQNKILSLTLKVWETDFISCSEQISLAATYLRSRKIGFSPLYVQYEDRYYEALTQSIKKENTAGRSVRTQEYQVQFETKPWLTSISGHTLTGTGLIDTDQVSRTLSNGGWSPVTLTLTGTNITVSGYTYTGEFAGYIHVSGSVTNLVVDSDAVTATIGGINKNEVMLAPDYRVYVGAGKTYFNITGASSCTIQYNDRWLL